MLNRAEAHDHHIKTRATQVLQHKQLYPERKFKKHET